MQNQPNLRSGIQRYTVQKRAVTARKCLYISILKTVYSGFCIPENNF